MTIGEDIVFRRRPDVRFRRVGGESVVIRQAAGEVLVLNGVGGRVLELSDGSVSLSELITRLESEFDAESGVIAGDVKAFVSELESVGLIEVVSERRE